MLFASEELLEVLYQKEADSFFLFAAAVSASLFRHGQIGWLI